MPRFWSRVWRGVVFGGVVLGGVAAFAQLGLNPAIVPVAAALVLGGIAAFATWGYLGSLQQQVAAGATLARLLVVLGDPLIEAVVADLLKEYLQTTPPATGAAVTSNAPARPRRGFFARLFGKE